MVLQIAADRAVAKLLDVVALPPTFHIGLAESHRSIGEHSSEKSVIPHADVAGPIAIDGDIRLREKSGDGLFRMARFFGFGPNDGELGFLFAGGLAPRLGCCAHMR